MSKDKLILSYFGTLGISQNVSFTFPYAAKIKEKINDFEYLIIGDGARVNEVRSDAKLYDFVRILPGMSSENLEPYYAKTLLSVVVLNKSENFKYTIPSKLFQIMGRGIAVLFIGPDGETADIIRKYHAGIVLDGAIEKDYQLLSEFFLKPNWYEQLKVMGKNGRKAVENNYSRKKLAEKFANVLSAAVANR